MQNAETLCSQRLTGSPSCDMLNNVPKTVGPLWGKYNTPTEERVCHKTFLPSCLWGGFFIWKTPFGREEIPTIFYKEVNKMAKVELKQPVVQEISERIKDAQSVVLVDHRGLTVEQDTQLRRELREAGVTYKVYKNTMMNFAFKGTACEELAQYLEGPSAMAVSTEDATAPARALAKFAKKAPKLEIKGGVVEGTVYDAAGIANIASIPSREELISKLLGSLQSPITNFARVMNQLAEKGGASACEAPAEAAAEETPAAVTAEEAPAAEEAAAEEAPAQE